jgi:hypothetical protein
MNVLSKSLIVGLMSGGLLMSSSALAAGSHGSILSNKSITKLPDSRDSNYITKDNEVFKRLSSNSYLIKNGKVFLKAGKVITIHNAGGMKPKKVMLCGLKCGWSEFTN